MWHRQSTDHDLARLHVYDNSAVETAVAPAVDRVGLAHCRYIARHAIFNGEPVQVATVLLDNLGDKRRLPHRSEAVPLGGGGKAVVECVDEDDAAVLELPGLLSVNGSLPNAMFTVNDATLGGSGTIGGFTGTGGLTVAPGNSIGTLTSNGNVAF
jgi:hypothetical protein